MTKFKYIALAALAGVACIAPAAADLVLNGQPSWTAAVTQWHYDAQAPHRLMVMYRQIGTQSDTVDDTRLVTFTDINGNQQTEHASSYMTLDLSPYLPSNVKVAQLSIKTIITKPSGVAVDDVFVFLRTPGSSCCVGPATSPATPVDFSVSTNVLHDGIAAQSVLQTPGGIRDFVPVTVALVNDEAQIAWGYQRGLTDSIGFDVYLDGYGS